MTEQREWNYSPNTEGAIPIPVRIGSSNNPVETEDDDDKLIREYEARYYGKSQVVSERVPVHEKRKNSWDWDSAKHLKLPPRYRYDTRPAPEYLEENERMWAAIAHGSALLTLIALITSGPGVLLTLLIPLGIYLMFRRRSQYVAFHALQAFTFQTVATIGTFSAILVTGLLILVSAIFSIILVGIPFLLLFLLLLPIVILISVLMIFLVMPVYSMIAAAAAWGGRNYRYPYIADWVDDQLTNGIFRTRYI